ncbi:MAG: hypothetical protein HY057_01695 [Rhodospirillales bacterium]|nr:hypothetical protein [Rhodospirillales bacterium]
MVIGNRAHVYYCVARLDCAPRQFGESGSVIAQQIDAELIPVSADRINETDDIIGCDRNTANARGARLQACSEIFEWPKEQLGRIVHGGLGICLGRNDGGQTPDEANALIEGR